MPGPKSAINPVIAIPLPGIQSGTKVADNLEFRASFESLLAISVVSADILYIEDIPDQSARYYLGGGGDVLF